MHLPTIPESVMRLCVCWVAALVAAQALSTTPVRSSPVRRLTTQRMSAFEQEDATLTAVRGTARVSDNDALLSLSPGLDHLRSVGLNCAGGADACAGFEISRNANLAGLPRFDELEVVNSSLAVLGNSRIGSIDGFPRLSTVSGAMRLPRMTAESTHVNTGSAALTIWVKETAPAAAETTAPT